MNRRRILNAAMDGLWMAAVVIIAYVVGMSVLYAVLVLAGVLKG